MMQYKFEKPVHGTIGNVKYQCTIEWRNGKLITDEPVATGGKDSGPDPYTLLLSSLASCTLITMRMYIDHKGLDIPEIGVNVNLFQETKDEKVTTIIDRDIVFLSKVDEEQKLKLLDIAKHCPISKILEGDIQVRTFLYKDGAMEKKVNYPNNEITVVWKPDFCQHSARCWQQLPEVFNYKLKKWINPDGASSERIIEQVNKCPSGALTYFYNKPQMNIYSTLVDAINGLRAEGYTEDFNLKQDCLDCRGGEFKLFHDEFVIDKSYRFDVDSDAADQSVIYAISSEKHKLKGILVNSYGTYSDSVANELLDKLKAHS